MYCYCISSLGEIFNLNHSLNQYQFSQGFGLGFCRSPLAPRPCLTPPLHCHDQHHCHLADGAGMVSRSLSWHGCCPCCRFPHSRPRSAVGRGREWERGNGAYDVSSCSSLRNVRSADSAMDFDLHCDPSYENSCINSR